MRVLLKLVLDCDPDAAWQALRSPKVFRAVAAPFSYFTSLEPGGFPESWAAGDHPVQVSALGLVPVGEQVITISFPTPRGETLFVRDSGHGVSGPLALVTEWEHTMAVTPYPGDKTLYRDQLKFSAGPMTPVIWPVFWAFWQWRAAQLTRLARRWAGAEPF